MAAASPELKNHVDPLSVYLHQIGEHPLLNAEQEVELYEIMQAGREAQAQYEQRAAESTRARMRREEALAISEGEQAKERFIKSNLRLVVSLANRYPETTSLSKLDHIQNGNFGLYRAVEKFDGTKGFKFSTYATWWIRQFIERGMTDQGRTIRIPSTPSDKLRAALRDAEGDIEQLSPDMHEIWTLAHPASLNKVVNNSDESTELGDMISADTKTPEQIALGDLDSNSPLVPALGRLSVRHQRIVSQKFGLEGDGPKTLQEIGEAEGVTRETIRKELARALASLKSQLQLGEFDDD